MLPLRSRRPFKTSSKATPAGRFGLLLFILLILCAPSLLGAANLEWDPNPDADHYIVYWRSAGENTFTHESDPIPAGTTRFALEASPNGEIYAYSIKAFNDCGNSSDFSDIFRTAHIPSDIALPGETELPAADYAIEIILPESGLTFTQGESTELSANALINGDVMATEAISWSSCLSGILGTGSDISATLCLGAHTITASLKDGQELLATDTVRVTVEAANTPPSVTIVDTVGDDLTPEGQPYTLYADATDTEDGDLSANIVWLSDLDGGLGKGASIKAVLSSGTHTLTARVSDSEGETVETSTTITVFPWNEAPTLVISHTADGEQTAQGLSVLFEGIAMDAENGDLSSNIVWSKSPGDPLGQGASLRLVLSPGEHTITALVTDSQGKHH